MLEGSDVSCLAGGLAATGLAKTVNGWIEICGAWEGAFGVENLGKPELVWVVGLDIEGGEKV